MICLYWLTSHAERWSCLIKTLRSLPWYQLHLSWDAERGPRWEYPGSAQKATPLTLLR